MNSQSIAAQRLSMLCLLFLLGIVSLSVSAQGSLELGPEYEDKLWDLPPTPLGFDETGYYFYQVKSAVYVGALIQIRASKEKFYLRKFDHSLNPQEVIELELQTDGNDEIPMEAVYINGKIFLFSTFDNFRRKKKTLYVREIPTSTLDIPTAGRVVCEASYQGYPRSTDIGFNIFHSRDSSKMLIQYAKPADRDEPESYHAILFNDEMVQLWEQDFTLPYEQGLFDAHEFKIDNGGSVYLLGKQYFEKRRERIKGIVNYNFKILSLKPGYETPDEFTLEIPGLYLDDVQLEILPSGDLVCVGAYKESEDPEPKGLVYLTLDGATQEVLTESREEFDLGMFEEELPTGGSRRRQKRAAERAFYNYDFREVVLRSDGGAVLIGEATYVRTVTRTTTDANGMTHSTTTYQFHNDDIITVNISPEGEIENAHRIAKRQMMANSNVLLSFALGISPGALYFVYNDNVKNNDLPEGEIPVTYVPSLFGKSKQVVKLAMLGGEEELDYEVLTSVSETDMFAIPMASKQVSPTEVILIFQNKKKRRLGRITLD